MPECPNSKSGKHYYLNPPTIRSDFEPTTFGDTVADTLFRRVEYVVAICSCGKGQKSRIESSLS